MTTETETEPQDFAAFEAAAKAGGEPETPPPADEPSPEVNDEAKPLELTDEDELVEDDDEKGEKDDKRRHKPAKQRIAEQRWQIGERDRKIAELEARLAGGSATLAPATLAELQAKRPDPNDEKYEFGSASEEYTEDLADWKFEVKMAERDAKDAEESSRTRTAQEFQSLDDSWAEAEARGAEKYDDFTEKLEDFKANAPCPPLMAVAIQASPVADDVTYHLANNQDVAHLIAAKLNGGDPLGAARQFGEIEGQFMDKRPQVPGRDAHPMDHAMYAGRLQAFLAKKAKPAEVRATNAPVPYKHPVRGGGGKVEVDGSTTDFAAFEKKANAAK